MVRPCSVAAGLVCVPFLALLAGCPDAEPAPLRVLAASSLTDALDEVNESFAASTVRASYAGSQILRLQIEQGAPADVFVSADERHMDALVRAGLVVDPVAFARTELVVIVPREDPTLATFADLPRAQRIVLADPEVPAGRYADQLLARASAALDPAFEQRVRARVVSEESNVRLVRAKVELGEADAAIVYRSDAAASDRLRVIPVPASASVRATYYVGIVASSARREGAQAWIDHLRGAGGRAALERHGFTVAPEPGAR